MVVGSVAELGLSERVGSSTLSILVVLLTPCMATQPKRGARKGAPGLKIDVPEAQAAVASPSVSNQCVPVSFRPFHRLFVEFL